MNNYLSPSEIAEFTISVGEKKATSKAFPLFILGILAGAFIAFASEGSTMACFGLLGNPNTFGLGKALAGSIFGTGLMLTVIAGGELFTGNTLMIMGVMEKKYSLLAMLRNWCIVYIGNFVGSMLIAFMMVNSGQFGLASSILGGTVIKIASAKVSLSFEQALFLGIMCNWLVCLAVWMAYGAKDITGKILAIFFPIWLFITSGFEHSVANMYYIPAGIMAKGNSLYYEAALSLGISSEKLAHLTWESFLINNLLPVTLGNIIGGCVFVGGAYFLAYRRK